MNEKQRLDKILSNSGFGTRNEVRLMLKKGLVRVDGVLVKDAAIKVDPRNSEIIANGRQLHFKQYFYFMLNKPKGVISATEDPRHKTCLDLLPHNISRLGLFPAGRLDIDTEGLLLVTNDGQLAHELLSPKKHVQKKYVAKILGEVTEEDVEKFSLGLHLEDGYKTLPSKMLILSKEPADKFIGSDWEGHGGTTDRKGRSLPGVELLTTVEVILTEGKFHQIKRMFEAIGKKVVALKRMEMGILKLDDTLLPGEYRELTEDEIDGLKRSEGSGKQ